MDCRGKLFFQKDPYRVSSALFVEAVRDNIRFQAAHCAEYAGLLKAQGLQPEMLRTEADLCRIPVIPTPYFKRNRLLSMPEKDIRLWATSSGTTGAHSVVGFDRRSFFYGLAMVWRFFSYHRLISAWPANYIVLGYEPSGHNRMGAVKTAFGATRLAPALHREYALKDTGSGYTPNLEGVVDALRRYEKQHFPVRFVGFPYLMYRLAEALREQGISFRLNQSSKVILGGGWKHMDHQEVDRDRFYALIDERLGIRRENCLEFFSAVEHPIPYCRCQNGHFHVPAYSRVIIRDVNTLEPLPMRQTGLLSFVTPLVYSMPLVSVMTDDLAALYDGSACGCGARTPYFELMGRAGERHIQTCAAGAAERLGGEAL